MANPRTSSLHSPPASAMSYFDFQPDVASVSPIKKAKHSGVVLDSFHQRPCTTFEYPANASIYARRALPPLPPPTTLPALRNSSSSESFSSSTTSRPSTATSVRNSTDKCLPPLPLRLRESPSFESECKESIITIPSRPRTGRGYSFRSFLGRQPDDNVSLASPKSTFSTNRESRTDSLIDDYSLTHVKTNGTTTSTVTRGRRPSALSLSHIRTASRKLNSNPPPMPSRPTSRKGSCSSHSQHRWGLFRTPEDDKEDIPPMPTTPGVTQELSFTQCYYFYARNCNGYVLSNGPTGDACENCARSGFLGSP